VPWYGTEIGREVLIYVWSVTSRWEDPDDFPDGQRVTVWLRKSQRSVTTVVAVRPGSQRT